MKLRSLALLTALSCAILATGSAHAQGFVFGTAQPAQPAQPAKPQAAAQVPAGSRTSKVETAPRLLARMGLLLSLIHI